jgi:hypothetical protein
MQKGFSPCRAGGTLQTCRPRKTTNKTDPNLDAIKPGATKSHVPGPLVAPEPEPLPAPEPLAKSVKAEQRRNPAKATAEQARVLMPGRMAPAGDNPSLVEAYPVRSRPTARFMLPNVRKAVAMKPQPEVVTLTGEHVWLCRSLLCTNLLRVCELLASGKDGNGDQLTTHGKRELVGFSNKLQLPFWCSV